MLREKSGETIASPDAIWRFREKKKKVSSDVAQLGPHTGNHARVYPGLASPPARIQGQCRGREARERRPA